MFYCGSIVYVLFANAFDTFFYPVLQPQAPANLTCHPVANPVASLPGATQPSRLGKTQLLLFIACEGQTAALSALLLLPVYMQAVNHKCINLVSRLKRPCSRCRVS